MSDNSTRSTSEKRSVRPQVFVPSVLIVGLFVLLAFFRSTQTHDVISRIQTVVVENVGWYYILAVTGFVIFAFVLAFSRKGDTVLGPDDCEPDYSRMSWFAMLFAAGMGIGLVFWGAAEPLSHFANPKPGFQDQVAADATITNELGTVSAIDQAKAGEAMTTSFLHWGLHAWAIYVVLGLAIAYAVHRKGLPVSIRWALRPVLGDRVRGWLGDVIDTIAVIGTIFGIATSLGFGVKQVAAGFDFLADWKVTGGTLVLLVVVISGLAAISVATGLDGGIKFLSNTNLILAAILVTLVFILGPTLFLANEFVADIGNYFQGLIQESFETLPFAGRAGTDWLSDWTVYYWGWWMSWSPFVGIFIARISRGRTVREFILGVLMVPTLVTFIWFAILGGNGLYQQMFGASNLIGPDGTVTVDTVLFQTFANMPGTTILSILAMIVVIIFFVTSSDSGSYVMSMICSGGDPNPRTSVRLTFATLSGAIAAVMLARDSDAGMSALQTIAILIGLPFSVIMIVMCVALWRELAKEEKLRMRIQRREFAKALAERVSGEVRSDIYAEISQHTAASRARPIETTVDLRRFFERLSRQSSRSALPRSRRGATTNTPLSTAGIPNEIINSTSTAVDPTEAPDPSDDDGRPSSTAS
ncbi:MULTISPECIES: BCCT family transporter [unclassified Actinobaculum]|uniref:BCCT family transporter n=1 Tax=unclassified Actinobaculum TaxID=2609299 RepID=UPI000D52878F|nr:MULTISPECIES: BCCT family transporter [unclassified Actinobaculum]AWE42574.1 choline transporter [Actinobaculum sp. 313]RTE48138.1 BCCT family transporter [Actinobaculum sp. 352]